MEKRIGWVDTVKFLCILCVMASHLQVIPPEAERFIEPFYLMGFFFCSGYVYRHRPGFGAFLWKKTRQLLIPWVVFSLLSLLLSQILTFQPHGDLASELKWWLLQVRGQGDQMWFLAALFTACLPFYFFIRRFSGSARAWLLSISFALSLASQLYMRFMDGSLLPWGTAHLPWHLEYIFQGMFFMVLGCLFRESWEKKLDTCPGAAILAAIGLYVLLIYAVPANSSILYGHACCGLGVFCVVWGSKQLKANRYVSFIGGNTLICFGLNGKLASLINTMLPKLAGGFYTAALSDPVTATLLAAALALAMSAVLILPIWIINRWFPFAAGRTKKTVKERA